MSKIHYLDLMSVLRKRRKIARVDLQEALGKPQNFKEVLETCKREGWCSEALGALNGIPYIMIQYIKYPAEPINRQDREFYGYETSGEESEEDYQRGFEDDEWI